MVVKWYSERLAMNKVSKVRKHVWTTVIRRRRKNWSRHQKTKNNRRAKNKVTWSPYQKRSEGDQPHFEKSRTTGLEISSPLSIHGPGAVEGTPEVRSAGPR